MTNLVEKILTGQVPETGGLGALFAAHPVASLILARDGTITEVNTAARILFRCEAEALVGSPMVSFFPEIGNTPGATDHAVDFRRVAVRRPDGNNFIARLHIVPLGQDSDDSRRVPLLATIEDLTEYEAEIAATNRELESFTSAASHDLRGPLRILKGFTDALEDECGAALNDEGKTFLKEILKASDRMEGLIDGLLAMSRAGRAEMTCESLDVSTLVDLVYYELRHEQGERKVEFQVEPGINAWGDVRLMMTILRNLLGNAWKYTSRTEQASIRFYAEVRDGRTWYCVTDNGAGFDMAHAERLFQPFTRLHRQDEFPGHGLGLATVQRIVKRHGGAIEAQAAIKQGATVRFWMRPQPDELK
jgi:signal transduction histidine kinase